MDDASGDDDLDLLTNEELQERLRACEEKLERLLKHYAETCWANWPPRRPRE